MIDSPSAPSGFSVSDGDHLGGRQTLLVELSQQPVLAEGEVVGKLLDDVRHVHGLDQAHDVTMKTEDAVHVREVPVGEALRERKARDRGVERGIGDLQSHRHQSGPPCRRNSSRSVASRGPMTRRGSRSCHARSSRSRRLRASPLVVDRDTDVARVGTPSDRPARSSLRERLCAARHRHPSTRADPRPSADQRLALPAVRGVVAPRRTRRVHARWRPVDPAALAGGSRRPACSRTRSTARGICSTTLQRMEVVVAFAVVPLATAWAALATLNVRRATARRCNPVIAALSIPAAVAGVWAIGARNRGARRRLGDARSADCSSRPSSSPSR